MKTTGKTWKELEKAAMERRQWKSLVTALIMCFLGAMRIIYIIRVFGKTQSRSIFDRLSIVSLPITIGFSIRNIMATQHETDVLPKRFKQV